MNQKLFDTSSLKAIKKAEDMLNIAINCNDYSLANTKQGYLDGHCLYNNEIKPLDFESFIADKISLSLKEKDYGLAAYWQSFKHGYLVMETIYELCDSQTE